MTTWFTSDPHWGHPLVAKLRGFDTVEEHDTAVTASLRQHVWPGDDLWILGDLTANHNRDFPTARRELMSVRYQDDDGFAFVHLVYGNHDEAHPMHREARKAQRAFEAVFDSTQTAATIRFNRKQVLLSHFPYAGTDHTHGSRFDQWRMPDLGAPIVHGHTHSTDRVSRSPHGSLQIHVGWDAWRRPVELSEIHQIIQREA